MESTFIKSSDIDEDNYCKIRNIKGKNLIIEENLGEIHFIGDILLDGYIKAGICTSLEVHGKICSQEGIYLDGGDLTVHGLIKSQKNVYANMGDIWTRGGIQCLNLHANRINAGYDIIADSITSSDIEAKTINSKRHLRCGGDIKADSINAYNLECSGNIYTILDLHIKKDIRINGAIFFQKAHLS